MHFGGFYVLLVHNMFLCKLNLEVLLFQFGFDLDLHCGFSSTGTVYRASNRKSQC